MSESHYVNPNYKQNIILIDLGDRLKCGDFRILKLLCLLFQKHLEPGSVLEALHLNLIYDSILKKY